jgi:predicted Fe-Mo cluster-binding NifX family protein
MQYPFAMKIAIPYWQGRVSPVFDESREILLIDITDGREKGRIEMQLQQIDPLLRAGYIADLGTELLICGAISLTLAKALASRNVKIFPHTRGSISEIIRALIQGNLGDPLFLMPGCHRENSADCPIIGYIK